MPITIPRYSEAQVDPNSEPLPRAHGLSPEAFGAGLARGLGQTAGVMDDLAKKAVADTNTAATLNARNFLFQVESDTLYGDNSKPGQGVLKKKGLAAAQDEQFALNNYKKQVEEYEKTLGNDDQKLVFRTMAGERGISIQRMLAQHSRKEMDWHQDETLKATEETSRDRISMLYNQPDEVDREIAIIKFARNKRLDDMGVGNDPESAVIRANYLKDGESKALGAVVDSYMKAGGYKAATDFLEKNKDRFHGDDYDKRMGQIRPLADAQTGGDVAKEIFDLNPDGKITDSMSVLRERLKDNPAAKKHGEAELKAMYVERETARKQEADEAENAVYARLVTGQRPTAEEWSRLAKADPKRIDKIQDEMRREQERAEDRRERELDRAERRADRAERRADRDNGNQLMNWSNLVQDPASLKGANLDRLYYTGALSKQGYADLSRRRSELINSPEKENWARSKSEVVNDIFRAAGIKDKTGAHAKAWEFVENSTDRILKNPTMEDYKRAAREAVYKVPGTGEQFYNLTIDDVPAGERANVTKAFQKRFGRAPTSPEIAYYYGKMTMGRK